MRLKIGRLALKDYSKDLAAFSRSYCDHLTGQKVVCLPVGQPCYILEAAYERHLALWGTVKKQKRHRRPVAKEMSDGKAGWVEDQVDHYRLTEAIILNFLKNDCNISGTDADFNVKVILNYSGVGITH